MVFVDTGVWFAILFAKDPLHQRARIWFDEVNEELVTSDYKVDETLTLLLMRGEPTKARDFGRQIIVAGGARLAFVSEQQFNRSWLFFQQMASQGLSFTDCTSHIVARDLGVDKIASFDRHFLTTGHFVLVP